MRLFLMFLNKTTNEGLCSLGSSSNSPLLDLHAPRVRYYTTLGS